ncbi:hypothetical protein BS78_02G218400 [Paspalum vaginatum]|nr:hypothetical protein BS78_02G218400 [Paspalum vaginatum]
MPITLQPGLQLNLDGTVRDSPFLQRPMFSIPGPLLNALCAPSGIPALMSRIVFPNPISLLKQPWYQQRSINRMPGVDGCSYFEHQMCLQRECELQWKAMIPGAASLSYSFTFLQHYHMESVQRQEWMNRMIAHGCQ